MLHLRTTCMICVARWIIEREVASHIISGTDTHLWEIPVPEKQRHITTVHLRWPRIARPSVQQAENLSMQHKTTSTYHYNSQPRLILWGSPTLSQSVSQINSNSSIQPCLASTPTTCHCARSRTPGVLLFPMNTNRSASSLKAIILCMTRLIIKQVRYSWKRRFTCWIEDLIWSTNTVSSLANWPERRHWWRRISRIWHSLVRTCRTSNMKNRLPSKEPTVIKMLSSSVSQKLFRPKRQGHIMNSKAITPDRISVTDQLNKSKGRQP